jgi:hypothetical protein
MALFVKANITIGIVVPFLPKLEEINNSVLIAVAGVGVLAQVYSGYPERASGAPPLSSRRAHNCASVRRGFG